MLQLLDLINFENSATSSGENLLRDVSAAAFSMSLAGTFLPSFKFVSAPGKK